MKNKKIAKSSIVLAVALAVVIGVFIYSVLEFSGQPRQSDERRLQSNVQYQQPDGPPKQPKHR